MPTEIERAYLTQSHWLPDGLTWDMVAKHRARWGIASHLVPVALVRGRAIGWAVPGPHACCIGAAELCPRPGSPCPNDARFGQPIDDDRAAPGA